MVVLVFLHGIGEGGISGAWQTELGGALRARGYPALDGRLVIAPRYTELLSQQPSPKNKMPPMTVKSLTEGQARRERWEYERRQASLERILGQPRPQGVAFEVPEALKSLVLQNLGEAHRYVSNEGLRACILRRVLDVLPVNGEIVMIGHSLGSLVAIDILDQLPPNLIVRRLVTIGSPAGHVVMHEDRKRLLKEFPLSRIKSWANLWTRLDPVPAGRGIAHLFPRALDVQIDSDVSITQRHAAETYLSHPTVATAVGEAVFGSLSHEITPVRTDVDRKMEEAETIVVAGLAYGHYLADELAKDPERQARFRAALDDVQRAVIAKLSDIDERGLSSSLAILADGRRPRPQALLSVETSVPALLSILAGNVIAPYEVEVKKEQKKHALERLTAFLEFPQERGTVVWEAFGTAQKSVRSAGLPLSRVLIAVVGVLLVAAGPIGLVLAAPAGLAGGAAIVSALAAFGPGGMVGGLLTAGALASAGAGVAGVGIAGALAASSASAEAVEAVAVQQLATAIAREMLKDPRDDSPWFVLCNLETEIVRELQRLEACSDKKARSLLDARRKAEIVRLGLQYMVDHHLSPTDGGIL